jgi:hypothetical protein
MLLNLKVWMKYGEASTSNDPKGLIFKSEGSLIGICYLEFGFWRNVFWQCGMEIA